MRDYLEFIARVEELGFMPLSHQFCSGLPHLTLVGETVPEQWHTGAIDDPWRWKDIAAQEGRLAYGCILGGFKGFVAPWMYPAFYAACHPRDLVEDWEAGRIDRTVWALWQLFDQHPTLSTADARQRLKDSHKPARIDAAIILLQRDYHITGAGSVRKRNRQGQEYGWQINQYQRVTDWAPREWLTQADEFDGDESRDLILARCATLGGDPDMMRAKMGWNK